MKKALYFDYASATPQSDAVTAAMQPYFKDIYYNPSALYLAAKKTKKTIDDYRSQAADCLQVRPSEVFFMAGSTEANNTVIHGILATHKNAHIVISAIEHESVIAAAKQYNHTLAPVLSTGIINLPKLEKSITSTTVLISCMAANNELGTVQPISEVAKLVQDVLQKRRDQGNELPLYLHVDASQSFNYMALLPHQQGIDFAVVSGSKIYGPKQTALLYKKASIPLQPLIVGGGQEHGLRSGTENVAGIAGLTTAIVQAHALRGSESKRLATLRTTLFTQLTQLGGTINGSLVHRLPSNIHVTFAGIDNELLVMQLDEAGCMVATGSACSASSDLSSHVLKAIGLSDAAAQSSIRITLGRDTTTASCEHLIVTLTAILRRS